MTILSKKTQAPAKITIDLDGPGGNAFALMGAARGYGRQLGYTPAEIGAMLDDMESGNYDHLLQVFDTHFGKVVDLIHSEADDEGDEE